MSAPERLRASEARAISALAAVLCLRMLGFYAVLPVLSVYASRLPGATPLLAGLSVGIYAAFQAILQIPLGLLSDRFGRVRTIAAGTFVFALGSFLAVYEEGIGWLIAGRALQGAGAVASVVIALAADVTRPTARSRAMGALGLAVGISLAGGLAAGPFLAAHLGVVPLFRATGVLSLAATGCVIVFLRSCTVETKVPPTRRAIGDVFRRQELLVLDGGAFLLHFLVTFVFVLLPVELERHLPWRQQWVVYPPILGPGILLMWIVTRHADRRGWMRPVLWLGAIAVASSAALFASSSTPGLTRLVVGLFLFALGVACLEPILPALVTRFAPREARGTAAAALGVCQFAGAFLGGLAGGHALAVGARPAFVLIAVGFALWTAFALHLPHETFRERKETPAP